MNWWPWLSPLDVGWWHQVDLARHELRQVLIDRVERRRRAQLPAGGRYHRPEQAEGRHVVAMLSEAVRLRALLDEEITYLVAESRARRISWARIGEALGCRRQSAQERYGQVLEDAAMVGQLDDQLAAVISSARAVLDDPVSVERLDAAQFDRTRWLLARVDTDNGRLLPPDMQTVPSSLERWRYEALWQARRRRNRTGGPAPGA